MVPKATVQQLYERWCRGIPVHELARERRCTKEAVYLLFKRDGLSMKLSRTCALPDCACAFTTLRPGQLCCCRKHTRLLCHRRENNVTVTLMECALPECHKKVWVPHKVGEKPRLDVHGGRRFCGKDHSDLHRRRINNGVYARLLGTSAVHCEVCAERLMVEEHHEVFDWHHRRSDKKSRTHYLCVTHHAKVHRGFAAYRDGVYVDLEDEVRLAVSEKRKSFDGYLVERA